MKRWHRGRVACLGPLHYLSPTQGLAPGREGLWKAGRSSPACLALTLPAATLGVDRFSKSRCSRLYQETERSAIFKGFQKATGQGWGDVGGGEGRGTGCPPHPTCSLGTPTGRTHQLRVHCSALSHPVVGDLTYGQASGREDQPFRMMLHAFYLRIPTHTECVEACTPDPFVPTLDACWSPHTLVRSLDQLVQVLRAAPDPEPAEGSPGPCSTPTPSTRPPETEAQRASCLQWLSEWTLEPDN